MSSHKAEYQDRKYPRELYKGLGDTNWIGNMGGRVVLPIYGIKRRGIRILVFTRVYETVGGRWGSPVYPVSGDIRSGGLSASRSGCPFRCRPVGLLR